jgi:hypothetical protein
MLSDNGSTLSGKGIMLSDSKGRHFDDGALRFKFLDAVFFGVSVS